MHRLVMNAQKGDRVDHIHRQTLDNRKSELWLCSSRQDQCNREGPVTDIQLTKGQVALIDSEDFELVNRYKWCASWNSTTQSFYALTNIRKPGGKSTQIGMHRLIMNAQPGEQVDHIHHQTLDNRKSELRLCTPSQNACNRRAQSNNTSGIIGVSWHKKSGKWRATIQQHGKAIHLGLYDTPELANEARCKAVAELHGEFALTA
jgi:hypothetical protein